MPKAIAMNMAVLKRSRFKRFLAIVVFLAIVAIVAIGDTYNTQEI